MSILNKDILTVVIATTVASVMILSSVTSIAENKTDINTESASINKLGQDNSNDVVAQDLKGHVTISGKGVMISPPSGPFVRMTTSEPLQQSVKSPVAPKAPVQSVRKPNSPSAPVSSVSIKAPPQQNSDIAVKENIKPIAPKLESLGYSAPSQGQTPPTLDSAVPTNTAPKLNKPPRPILPNHPQMPVVTPPNMPIWSQKGSNINGYPAQQYRYVPVPMVPSSISAPQMPMFRHSAPTLNYWVPNSPVGHTPPVQNKTPSK